MGKSTLFILLLFCGIGAFGQKETDSLTMNSDSTSYIHIPKRAAIFSAIIPGSGQIYNEIGYRKIPHKNNRAWWKVPIIYGGLGTLGYFFYYNNKYAYLTKKEYLFQDENPGLVLDQRFVNYPTDPTGVQNPMSLIEGYRDADTVFHPGFDIYANRRDLFMVGFIAFWGLNVLEAYVDAHFVTFDVSEDLTLSWYPKMITPKNVGLGLTLSFN